MIIPFWLFLVGLVFGSFVSAFTYRLGKGISWTKGRSFCPNCKGKISWYDNIPLLSYLLLSGKCRQCRKRISLRYPLIEFISGLSFMVLWLLWGIGQPIVFFLFIISFSVLIVDLEYQFIPDSLVFFSIVVIFSYLALFDYHLVYLHFFSGFASAFFLLLLHLITKGKGMGLGDVKFAILGGLVLGWPYAAVWMFLSFITGALFGTVLIIFKKASFGKKIPFGPYLVISFWLTLIYGNWFLVFLM